MHANLSKRGATLLLPTAVLVVAVFLGACTNTPSGSTPTPTLDAAAATATAGPALTATAEVPRVPEALVVQWEKDPKLGNILTDIQGYTLYTYHNDKPDTTTCTGDCAKTWPPLTIESGWQPFAGPGVPGKVGVIARPDGTSHVTYDGMPLYRYSGDKQHGDTNGQGLDNLWNAVNITPALPAANPVPGVTPVPTP